MSFVLLGKREEKTKQAKKIIDGGTHTSLKSKFVDIWVPIDKNQKFWKPIKNTVSEYRIKKDAANSVKPHPLRFKYRDIL